MRLEDLAALERFRAREAQTEEPTAEEALRGSAVARLAKGAVRGVPLGRTTSKLLGRDVGERQEGDYAGWIGENAVTLASFAPMFAGAKAAGLAIQVATKGGGKLATALGATAVNPVARAFAVGGGSAAIRAAEVGEPVASAFFWGGLTFAAFEGLGAPLWRAGKRVLGFSKEAEAIASAKQVSADLTAAKGAVEKGALDAQPKYFSDYEGYVEAEGYPRPFVGGSVVHQDWVPSGPRRAPDGSLISAPSAAIVEKSTVRNPTPREVVEHAGGLGKAPSVEAAGFATEGQLSLAAEGWTSKIGKRPAVRGPSGRFVAADEYIEREMTKPDIDPPRPAEGIAGKWVGPSSPEARFLTERAAAEQQGFAIIKGKKVPLIRGGNLTSDEETLLRSALAHETALPPEMAQVNKVINVLESTKAYTTDQPSGHSIEGSLARFWAHGKAYTSGFLGRLGYAPSHPAAKVLEYGCAERTAEAMRHSYEVQMRAAAKDSPQVLREMYDVQRGAKHRLAAGPEAQRLLEKDMQLLPVEEKLSEAQARGIIPEIVHNYVLRTVEEDGPTVSKRIGAWATRTFQLEPKPLAALAKKYGMDTDELRSLAGDLVAEKPNMLGQPLVGRLLSTTIPEGIKRTIGTEAAYDQFVKDVGLTRITDPITLHRMHDKAMTTALNRAKLLEDLQGWVDPATGQRLLVPVTEFRLHPEWKEQYTSLTGRAGIKTLRLEIDGVEHVARKDAAEYLSRIIPQAPGSDLTQSLEAFNIFLKRMYMIHPMYHGNNFARNLVSAAMGNPIVLFNYFKTFVQEMIGKGGEGRAVYKSFFEGGGEVMLHGRMVEPRELIRRKLLSGSNPLAVEELNINLLRTARNADPGFFGPAGKIGKVREADDWLQKKLFEHMGRNTEIVIWDSLSTILQREGAPQFTADRVASKITNDLWGTPPPESISNLSTEVGNWTLFARRWTQTNWSQLKGMVGFIDPAYNEAERKLIQEVYWRTTSGGLGYLYMLPQLMNLRVTGHFSWDNESGRKNDIAVWKDKETGRIFYINTLGFIKDFLTLTTNARMEFDPLEGAKRFAMNKSNPLLRSVAELVEGRSLLTGRTLLVPGANQAESLYGAAEYIAERLVPFSTSRMTGQTPISGINTLAQRMGMEEGLLPTSALRQDPMRSRLRGSELAPIAIGTAAGFFTGIGRTAEEQLHTMQFDVRDVAHERNLALEVGDVARADKLQRRLVDIQSRTLSDLAAQSRRL